MAEDATYTGRTAHVVFTNCLMPVDEFKQPIFIKAPGVNENAITVFSTEDKLHLAMSMCGVTGYGIQIITDGIDFADSVFEHDGIVIFYDLHTAPNGKERWLIITRDVWLNRDLKANDTKYN